MERSDPLLLEDYAVGPLRTLIYIPDFVSADEETLLLRHIYEGPVSKWKSLKNRRLQNWGGVVHEKGLLPQDLPPWITRITQRICEKSGLFPSPINHVLINEYLPGQGIMPHQDGPAYFPVVAILSLGCAAAIDFIPHSRLAQISGGEISALDEPAATNGGSRDQAVDPNQVSLLLMPRSLLIFKDDAYSHYLHGIEDSDLHRLDKVVNRKEAGRSQAAEGIGGEEQAQFIRRSATRVSLTCRLVPKVRRNLFKF